MGGSLDRFRWSVPPGQGGGGGGVQQASSAADTTTTTTTTIHPASSRLNLINQLTSLGVVAASAAARRTRRSKKSANSLNDFNNVSFAAYFFMAGRKFKNVITQAQTFLFGDQLDLGFLLAHKPIMVSGGALMSLCYP